MYARVATFESDPAGVDDAVAVVRRGGGVRRGPRPASKAPGCSCWSTGTTGKGLGITLFESEAAMRRGDEALNAMNPGPSERRTGVEFFEVPVHTVS